MFKVICVENTFNHDFLDYFSVGQLYECEPSDSIWKIKTPRNDTWCQYIWVDAEFEYSDTIYNKIKFEKYNHRKEKLERVLNDN